jgi:type III secretory pathway component EscV
LWRPKQIANDLWAAGEVNGDPKRPSVLLLWWWLAWLLGGQSIVGGLGIETNPTPRELRVYAIIDIGTSVISIVAAILACVVAIQITERLKTRASEVGTQAVQQLP